MLNYRGYLKPYEAKIRRLAREGKTPGEIARTLCEGVRSPINEAYYQKLHKDDPAMLEWLRQTEPQRAAQSLSSLIRHILRSTSETALKPKLKQRIARARKEIRDA